MRFGFVAAGVLLLVSSLARAQGVAPVFLTHPASIQAYATDSATFSVTVDGTAPITFQWRKDGVNLAGATAASYTIATVAFADAGFYDVVATNTASTTSLPGYLYVAKRPQTITFDPPGAVVAAGSGVVLNATASSGLPVTYTLLAGNAQISGGVLTGSGGNVIVRATQAGNATIATADPVDRTITFVAGALSPFITSPPLNQTVDTGASVTLRASAIGTPAPTYQWQKDGVTLADATGSVLTIANATLADAGRYTVTATNLLGTSTASGTLSVRAAPVFTAMPESQTVAGGEPATFTATVTGYPAPTFQWRKNGTAIAGATAATLMLRSATAADTARYDVVATNALGAATSATATLTVDVRDFSGAYFGRFAPAAGSAAGTPGDFVLFVRPNRTGVFLGYDSTLPAGLAIANLTVDAAGAFAQTAPSGTRTVTLRGMLNEATGELTAEIPEVSRTLVGTRGVAAPDSVAAAGLYQLALIGSAIDRGYLVVGTDGRALLFSANATAAEGATGTIGGNGRLVVTTPSEATIDLGFNNGAVSGTVRTAAGSVSLAGAIETLVGQERLVNLSVRSTTSNAAPLIAGFVVSGTGAKQVLVRVAGPALSGAPFNVANTLADPTLQLMRGNTVVGQNDEWATPAANRTAVTAASATVGAFSFRNGSTDAALVSSLQSAAYTTVVGGGNGTVLVEVYEVLQNNETPGARRLVNLSARGAVSPGAPMIAGFVIGGTAPQRVLIRGIGPTLAQAPFNVPGVLANPQLTLLRGTTPVKTNDDWFRDPDAALIRTASARAGAFALPAQSADAVVLAYLAPGAYTAQVSGPANANQANGSGVVLVEVYESEP